MFLISNFISAAANILDIILTILYWLILIRAIISWVNPDPFNPIVQFLYKSTEPFLNIVRRICPFCNLGGVDISPIIAFLLIYFSRLFVIRSLLDVAAIIRR